MRLVIFQSKKPSQLVMHTIHFGAHSGQEYPLQRVYTTNKRHETDERSL